MAQKRVLVMGLDCMTPDLAFDLYLGDMPNLRRLMQDGTWGELASSHPPITVPAWMVMATSRDPGTLGAYGFRHRKNNSYTEGWTANASTFDLPAVWDHLGAAGKKVCLVGLPPSYPVRPVAGWRVGCFLTPNRDKVFTYPEDLAREVLEVAPDYRFDVTFRTDSRDELLRELYLMADEHFRVVEHLAAKKPWDLLWFVEIGMDRIHHAFWKFSDPSHPLYEPGNPYQTAIRDYYRHIDGLVGSLLDRVGPETAVLAVSDHGAKAMRGAFCINQWLVDAGYLALKSQPARGASLEKCDVDWARTTAWAWGGYYARVFINVKGREPQGVVPPERYEATLAALTADILGIRDHAGRLMATRVLRPKDLYRTCRGDSPDLMVYLDDLSWRSAGTMGWDKNYLFENDTGPDDAVHAASGCFVMRAPGRRGTGRRDGLTIYDVAPTILDLFGMPVPQEMEGKSCLAM